MARVPESPISSQPVLRDQRGEQRIRTTDAEFGGATARALGGVAQSLGNVSNVLTPIAIKMQEEKDAADAMAAYTAMSDELRDYENGENGVLTRQGGDASGIAASAARDINDMIRRNGESLSRNAERAYKAMVARRRETSLNSISRHEAQQRRVYAQNQTQAMVDSAVKDAIAGYLDGDTIAASLDTARTAILANPSGQSAEVVQAQWEQAQSAVHSGVVQRLLLDNPSVAKAYYEANKDRIDGVAQARIETALKEGLEIQQAQKFTDGVMAEGLSETEALRRARSELDGTVEEKSVTLIKTRYAEADRVRKEADRQALDDAWSFVTDGGSVDDMDPSSLTRLPPRSLASLRTFELQRAKSGAGYAKVSDPDATNRLHRMWMDDRAAFAEADLNEYRTDLTEGDYKYWLSQQRSVDRQAERAATKAASYTLADRMAKEYMNAAGIDYGQSATKKDAQRAARVYSLIRTIVDDAHEAGKPVTRDELDSALSSLFLEGEIMGSGILDDDDAVFYEVAGTPQARNFVLDDVGEQMVRISKSTGVPIEVLPAVIDTVKKLDLPMTPDNIARVYAAGVR